MDTLMSFHVYQWPNASVGWTFPVCTADDLSSFVKIPCTSGRQHLPSLVLLLVRIFKQVIRSSWMWNPFFRKALRGISNPFFFKMKTVLTVSISWNFQAQQNNCNTLPCCLRMTCSKTNVQASDHLTMTSSACVGEKTASVHLRREWNFT